MPREMMFAEAIAVAITEEMQRDANVVFYGQNMAMTDRDGWEKPTEGVEAGKPVAKTATQPYGCAIHYGN